MKEIEKLYTIPELAGLLKISKKTVYNNWLQWKVEGRVRRIIKPGKHVLFPESEVVRLIKSFTIE